MSRERSYFYSLRSSSWQFGWVRRTLAEFVEKAERLARVFLVFDDWLARGGDLPKDWTRP